MKSSEPTLFERQTAIHQLQIPPRYLGDRQTLAKGVADQLNDLLFSYLDHPFRGIPLAYSNVEFTHPGHPAPIIGEETPCVTVSIRVQWLVLAVRPGAVIRDARVSPAGQSADGMQLSLFDQFTITIPATQLATLYDWDGECWRLRSLEGCEAATVHVGQPVPFVVIEVKTTDGLRIIGSIDRLNHPEEPKKRITTEALDSNNDKKKKRKSTKQQ